MTNEFVKAFGTTERGLHALLIKVHDAVPNRDKRRWELLARVAERTREQSDPDLASLAGALRDAALDRLNGMVARVEGTDGVLTHDQAKTAVHSTEVGAALAEIMEMAERAAVEAAPLSKQIDASLAKKADQGRLIERARELQVEKSREGQPISLLTAIDIAKAVG
ncbi:MAG: hypothetical protein AAF264_08440 [Pseudomonadota bacterium]